MAILFLIRHGHNDSVGKKLTGRLPGVHLNAEGQAQAQKLAEALADLEIKAVIASPLERAQETAEPIAKTHNLTVETLTDLLEIDFGKWQGRTFKQLKRLKLWKKVQKAPSEVRFPDGESFSEAQERVAKGLIALSEQYGEKEKVVCVAHSDVIRLAVAYFLGLPLDHFQRIRIAPASISILFLHEGNGFFGPINHSFDFPKNLE